MCRVVDEAVTAANVSMFGADVDHADCLEGFHEAVVLQGVFVRQRWE